MSSLVPPAPAPKTGRRPARGKARRIALGVVGLLSVFVTASSAAQIVRIVLFPDVPPGEFDCRAGLVELHRSVERARGLAAGELGGERKALDVFRRSLEPEWSDATAIRAACQESPLPGAREAFRKVELLRYAEERAVRYEALDLARLRRKTPEALEHLDSPAPL